jgi:hypothetical protein
MPVLEHGAVIAGHRIEAFVGRGGMGVVYRARQLGLDRLVALKVIAPELLHDAGIRARFLQEARAAAGIDHPNVIPVHAAGEDQGVAYIAMRFVEGDDLRTLIKRTGPRDPRTAAALIGQAAAALDAIHAAGYVHRDVKPANLLVTPDGHVYLTDFGLAKQIVTRSGATGTKGWVGTLDYVAPEQIRGGRIDARADVYALGGVLHFTLTGRVPFEHEAQEAKLWAQLREPPPVPSLLVAALPSELDAAVARAMAKDPEERYPSAGDLGRAVRAGAAGTEPSEPERIVARGDAAPGGGIVEQGLAGEAPTVTAAAAPKSARRRVWPPAVLAALIGAGIAALILSGNDAPQPIGPGTPTGTATATAPVSVLHVVGTTRRVGSEPSGIALAGRDAWVISYELGTLTRLSRSTGAERADHPHVGVGASDITADGDAVWVALNQDRAVVRVDARTGKVTRRIATDAPAVHVAAGPSGLWFSTHPSSGPDELVHYDRSGSRRLDRRTIADGVGPMALGGGSLWFGGRSRPTVERVDLATGRLTSWQTLDFAANALIYAQGHVWASMRQLDSIAKVAPRGRGILTSEAGHNPAELAVQHGSVFVASSTDHTVVALDPRTLAMKGTPVGVPFNPNGLAADAEGVWVTGQAGNTVTRLAYR